MMLPPADFMFNKLRSAGMLGTGKQKDFLSDFVQRICKDRKSGLGIATSWNSVVLTSVIEGYPGKTLSQLESKFDSIIDAIIPDKEVAANAKENNNLIRLRSLVRQG